MTGMWSEGYGGQAMVTAEALALVIHVWKWYRSNGSGMELRERGAVPLWNVNKDLLSKLASTGISLLHWTSIGRATATSNRAW